MSVFVVDRVEITDPAWIEGYIPAVEALVESHGGKYLVRSNELEVVASNGEAPQSSW